MNYKITKTMDGSLATFSPPAWNEFARRDWRTAWVGASFSYDDNAVAFMGKRKRPDGAERLVIISGGETNLYNLFRESRALVIPLPSLFEPPPEPMMGPGSAWHGRWRPAHLHTGIADPKDPTHIVFKFTYNEDFWPATGERVVNSKEGIIDAYLQDDDSFRLALRMTDQLREDGAGIRQSLSGGPSAVQMKLLAMPWMNKPPRTRW